MVVKMRITRLRCFKVVKELPLSFPNMLMTNHEVILAMGSSLCVQGETLLRSLKRKLKYIKLYLNKGKMEFP
jgi:hypothetical protein